MHFRGREGSCLLPPACRGDFDSVRRLRAEPAKRIPEGQGAGPWRTGSCVWRYYHSVLLYFASMRVLFLNPPFHPRFSREQRSPAVTKSGTLYYPKWLATAAGVAIKNGHEVDLVDAPAAGYSVLAVIDRMRAKNIEAVVCDTSTPSILNDVSVIEALVAANPALHVLLVGRHVSSLPKETLAMSAGLEAIAVREYEYTVRDWLEAKGSWRRPLNRGRAGVPRQGRRDCQQQTARSDRKSG